MKVGLNLLFAALLALILGGCVSGEHSFEGLTAAGDPIHPVTISPGRFYKSSDGTWHFDATWYEVMKNQPTESAPYAFAIESDQADFKVQDFSVRDQDDKVLSFVQLAPAYEDHPDSDGPKYLVILTPGVRAGAGPKTELKGGSYRIEIQYFAGGKSHSARWNIVHHTKQRLGAWGMLGIILVATIACAELPLLVYRIFLGVNPAYPWVAAPIRALAYSPCIVGAGHGVMPMLSGPAIWFLLKSENGNTEVIWLFGMPAVIVATVCFAISTSMRRANIEKKRSNQAPRLSVNWKRGMPLFETFDERDRRTQKIMDPIYAQRVRRRREIHALGFYLAATIIVSLLIGLLI